MINIIKSFIKKSLYPLGLNIESNSKSEEVRNFILRFNENYISTDLIRVGGNGDGGYLVPDILDNIDYCFSAGVGEISTFEKELSEIYQIKSYMADASVNSPPHEDKNFFFIKKFLSSKTKFEFITLKDWLSINIVDNSDNKILQMDIEGSEYDVLTFESAQTLKQFSLMIVEFHKLENLSNPIFLKMANAIFEKIYDNFYICHVHPNNFSGIYNFKNIKIPSSIEVTFIRKDLINEHKSSNKIFLPHALDKKNHENSIDFKMPEIWWKK